MRFEGPVATRVITISNDTDFLRQIGPHFVDELRADASDSAAPDQLKRDWSTLANWLGYNVGDLTTVQRHKVEKAWMAYLSAGLAPSLEMQSAFSSYKELLKSIDIADRAPTEVMDVFDRLLATDTQIEKKRAADIKELKAQLEPLFDKPNRQRPEPWWWRQSPLVRRWIFASAVWAALMFVYFGFFDPFDTGGWDRANDEEKIRFYLIVLAPVAAGTVYYAYRKWVR